MHPRFGVPITPITAHQSPNMKILIPTDFSKCADNATRYGFEIAARTGATVTLLHVVYPYQDVNNNVYEAFWIDDYLKQRKSEIQKVVARFRRNARFSKILVEAKVEIGFPVPQICQMAEEMGADLIVIGSTGSSNLAAMFLGSNAGGVMGRTRVPVLVVPKKAVYHTSATAVFATDFKLKLSGHSLAILKKLMDAHEASVKILHIINKPGEQPDKAGEELVSKKLFGVAHHFHYLHDSDVPQAVSNFIESTEAHLLISISHDHNLLHRLFYESVTRALAHRVSIPMLVLHDD